MRESDTPICPIPGLGYCVRERCNFWDEAQEQCSGACFVSCESLEVGVLDSEAPCLIPFYEDYD
jgi:hypothetical protein